MANVYVSNKAQLLSALSSASAGSTIILKNGDYGSIETGKDFSSTVTVRAENSGGARFDQIQLNSAEYIDFAGLSINGQFRVNGGHHIGLTNSEISGQVYTKDTHHIVITDNRIEGVFHGVILNDVHDFQVVGNEILNVVSDILRITGDSYNGLVERNEMLDMSPRRLADGSYDHADAIQLFAYGGSSPHDIVIRGNLIWDDPATGGAGTRGQGIFVSDGGYRNILIEQNLIQVGSPNSIYINSAVDDVVVQNNSLMTWYQGAGGVIKVIKGDGATVQGNITKALVDEPRSNDFNSNYVYSSIPVFDMFAGYDGGDWRSYIPNSGAAIGLDSGYGASALLKSLIKSGGDLSSAPGFETAPVPAGNPSTPDEEPGGTLTQPTPRSAERSETPPLPSGEIGLGKTEAEGLSLGGTYGVESVSVFSGGAGIKATGSGTGTASGTFTGAPGTYWIDVDWFDENDGVSQFALLVNGAQQGSWTGSGGSNTLVTQRVAVTLNTSDTITLQGVKGAGEYARIDSLTVSESRNDGPSNLPAAPAVESRNDGATDLPAAPAVDLGRTVEFNGRSSDILVSQHQTDLETDMGAIFISFEADRVERTQGLLSKDAAGYSGGGNHYSAFIRDGDLVVRFQDESRTKSFSVDIEANQTYEVLSLFNDDEIRVYLDGTLVGRDIFDMDWTQNKQYLQIGGLGARSADGSPSAENALDGTIFEVGIYDGFLEPDLFF